MPSLKRNFIYNLVYQLFTMLMPLITAPYLARVLGVKGLGMYSYTFTVAEYFVYFAMLGVANYGNRTIAATKKENKSRCFVEIYAVQLTVSVAVFALYLFFAFNLNSKYRLLTCLQSLYVLSAAFDVTWYFFAEEKFKITTIRNVIVKLLALVLIFTLVKKADDVWIYTLIMALSYLVSQLIMWMFIFREIHFTKPAVAKMGHHLISMLVLFIPVIAITLYKMMDKILLESLGSITDVGYYESVGKIVRVPALVIAAIGTSMLPRMSKMYAVGEKDAMKKYFGISTEFAAFLTFGMVAGLMAVSSVFIPIYYGKGFECSIGLLQLLSLTLIFTSWASAIRNQYLMPMKHDKEYITSVFVGAILNLVLNIVMIPQYGAMGSVVATIIAEASVAVVQSYAVRKELDMFRYGRQYIMYVIPAMLMLSILNALNMYIGTGVVSLFVLILAGTCIYTPLSLVLMKYSKSDMYAYLHERYKLGSKFK